MWGVSGLEKSKKLKQTRFVRLHPFVSFYYFLVILNMIMITMHPVLLMLSFLSAVTYSVYLNGRKQLLINIKLFLVPVLVCLINPLVNHQGVTILGYLNDNPITKEAILFGAISGIMLYDVLLVFHIFNQMITEDKIICVMCKIFPIGSLLLTMAFRFVPMYQRQYRNMQRSLKCIGQDSKSGNIINRVVQTVIGLSALITWCLENAIETSDSMKARGFLVRKRTYYNNTALTKIDRYYLILEGILSVGLLVGLFRTYFSVDYFPIMRLNQMNLEHVTYLTLFTIFSLLPLLIDLREAFVWHILKSKI